MDKKAPEPMDDTTRERRVGTPSTNSPRACYAIKTLVAEFRALFPETATELSNYDGRNTALTVTFDLTSLSEDDRTDATILMSLLNDPAHNEDQRIDYVLVEDEQVLVTMRASARTQDRREPFGLADALDVLAGEEDAMSFEDEYELTALAGDSPGGFTPPGNMAVWDSMHEDGSP